MLMTPKQRIAAAMNMQPTDKIPLMCQFSIGHMLLQLNVSPAEFWFDKDTFAKGLLRLRDTYDFDGILVSLHGHDPQWRESVSEIIKSEEAEIIEWKNGDKTVCPFNDLPYFEFKNDVPVPDINSFDLKNLPLAMDYIPVSQNLHFKISKNHKFDVLKDIIDKAGEEYSIHGEITSPFDYFLDLFGHQDGLMALIDQPEKAEAILSHYTDLIKNLALEMCETGIDAIKISSPFAGANFISPEDYSRFVLPFEKVIASAIRERKVHVYTHTCGSIGDRLELMFDAGISGIECLDPHPIGNVELEDAVKRIGEKGFIKGNLDSVNLLLLGSTDEIIREVNKTLDEGSRNPGFILSTACSIAPAVKKENILILREITDKWNRTKN